MGYVELDCQLCGVGFSIARYRKAGEPASAAWADYGSDYCDMLSACEESGCTSVAHEGRDPEHIAGPTCDCEHAYSGWIVPVESMRDIIRCQALAIKREDWAPEAGNAEYELQAQHCFVTGISSEPPNEMMLEGLYPVRHGLEETIVSSSTDGTEDEDEIGAIPMHPMCFELYKRVSTAKLGRVDIDGLWRLRS
ncbi:hypothetical protein LTR53_015594, partial [Teratosphaeriaceae sp. CCFEE 6253]